MNYTITKEFKVQGDDICLSYDTDEQEVTLYIDDKEVTVLCLDELESLTFIGGVLLQELRVQ